MLAIIYIYFNFTIIINNSLNGVQAYCAAIKQIDLKYILGQNNYGDNVFSCEFLTFCGQKMPVGLQTHIVLPPGESV